MRRTLLLLALLSGCAHQAPSLGFTENTAPPRPELAGYAAEPAQTPQEERCKVEIDQYYKDLARWEASQEELRPVTDEEREEFARQQGEARQDDICYVRLRESRQGATYVQVPCGRPALEYRSQKGMLNAPHLPRVCEQYDDRAVAEGLRAYQALTNGK